MTRWADTKIDWLSKFLDMSAGVLLHDRFNEIFRQLKPDEFERCLLSWITARNEVSEGQMSPLMAEHKLLALATQGPLMAIGNQREPQLGTADRLPCHVARIQR